MESEYFKEFNMDDVIPLSKILVIGVKDSRHEHIIADLLENYDDNFICDSIVINPKGDILTKLYPSININNYYSSEVIMTNLYNGKRNAIIRYIDNYDSQDVIFNTMMHNSKYYKKDIIVVTQDLVSFPMSVIDQFDYIFLSYFDNEYDQTKLYFSYGKVFPTFNVFQDALNGVTCGGELLVIKNFDDNAIDKVFWYTIPEIDFSELPDNNEEIYYESEYLTIYI